jgi:hypothetical protein
MSELYGERMHIMIRFRVNNLNEMIQREALTLEQVRQLLEKSLTLHPYLWKCIFSDTPFPTNPSYIEALESYYMNCIINHGQYQKRLRDYEAHLENVNVQVREIEQQKRRFERIKNIVKEQELLLQRGRKVLEHERKVFQNLRQNLHITQEEYKLPMFVSITVAEPPPAVEEEDVGEQKECLICYDDLHVKECVLLTCKMHKVCSVCFVKLPQQPTKKRCPLCRKDVDTVYCNNPVLSNYYSVVPIDTDSIL